MKLRQLLGVGSVLMAYLCSLTWPSTTTFANVRQAVRTSTQTTYVPAVRTSTQTPNPQASSTVNFPLPDRLGEARVLIIGSSVAAGWHDEPQGGGFLVRAFRTFSKVDEIHYRINNKSIPGQGVMHIINDYPDWLATNHPKIVVLAWGGLDDLHDKTPIPTFRDQIRWQIQNALNQRAVVFVVTPPVSRAAYTTDLTQLPNILDNEMDVAESLHNDNVYVFDVFNQMKQYLAAHGQTYAPYVADGWHPNAAGHQLAGAILAQDLAQTFGSMPIRYQARS